MPRDPRAIVLVLDSVGAGELPDAESYGDAGSNTLGNTARAAGGLSMPNLGSMGLGNITDIAGVGPVAVPTMSGFAMRAAVWRFWTCMTARIRGSVAENWNRLTDRSDSDGATVCSRWLQPHQVAIDAVAAKLVPLCLPDFTETGKLYDYRLDKLLAFHLEHETPYEQIMRDLHHAAAWIPIQEHAAEAQPLADRLSATRTARKTGPQPLAEILAIVLARLGVGMLPSKPSEERDLT